MPRLLLDLSPLRRHRDLRLVFVGQGISSFGSMITSVALPFQVYELTGSTLAVGLMGVAELLPLFVMALVGGALADARDRRRMVQLAEAGSCLLTLVLVVNAMLPAPQLWVLYAVAAASSAVVGLQRPSLDAMVPRLATREEMPAVSALESFRMNVAMVGGPAVAGVLLATIGIAGTYLVDLVTFAASLIALGLVRAMPPPAEATRPSLRGIADGWHYARTHPELLGTYLVDINATFFGMPTALFPALADRLGGPAVLGLLYAAPSVGSILATTTSGWVGRVHHHGRAVLWAAGAYGVAIAGVGLTGQLWVALLCLGLSGAADMISGIFRMTIWNQAVPDHLRGRLAGIEMLGYSTGPLLGDVRAGAVGSLFGPRPTLLSGGVLCVAGTIALAVALPGFRSYDARVHAPGGIPSA